MPKSNETRGAGESSSPVALKPAASGQAATVAAVLAIAAILLWIPLTTGLDFPAKRDEKDYHLPVVTEFVLRDPTGADLRDSRVEMGPFFHIVLGRIGRVAGGDPARLRLMMTIAGLASALLFAKAACRVPGADWRVASLLLAAFPYFGACYFTIMTDYGAFLALVAAWLAQIEFMRTGRERALWVAAITAFLAVLVRQTMIFAPAAFAAVVMAGGGHIGAGSGSRRLPMGRVAVALALPFLAIALRLILWGGLLPPSFVPEGGVLGIDASDPWKGASIRNYALALISVAANVGYYFAPATGALAAVRRPPLRTLVGVGLVAFLLTALIAILRGPQLVTTFGTFQHVVTTLRLRIGQPAGFAVVAVSLASFLWLVVEGARWTAGKSGGDERRAGGADAGDLPARRFLAAMFGAALLVLSFGKFQIFERYILPVHALAILLFAGIVARRPERLVRAGITAAVLFGLAQEILYARDVYEIGVPERAPAADSMPSFP